MSVILKFVTLELFVHFKCILAIKSDRGSERVTVKAVNNVSLWCPTISQHDFECVSAFKEDE